MTKKTNKDLPTYDLDKDLTLKLSRYSDDEIKTFKSTGIVPKSSDKKTFNKKLYNLVSIVHNEITQIRKTIDFEGKDSIYAQNFSDIKPSLNAINPSSLDDFFKKQIEKRLLELLDLAKKNKSNENNTKLANMVLLSGNTTPEDITPISSPKTPNSRKNNKKK